MLNQSDRAVAGGDDPEDRRLAKAILWALKVDPEDCLAAATWKQREHPGDSARQIGDRLVKSLARKGALEGFGSSLPSNPFIATGAAFGDMFYMLRQYAALNATVGWLADGHYFDDPDWKHDCLLVLAGASAVGQALKAAGVAAGEQASRRLVKKHLSKAALRPARRLVFRWFGKKVTQRAVITKMVPLVGGLIGATWNYAEMRVVGARIVKYHFDELLD